MALSHEHHSMFLFQEARKHRIMAGSRWAFLGNQRLRGCPRDNPDPALWRAWWGFDFPDPPVKLAKSKLHGIKPWMEFFGAAECVMFDVNAKDSAIGQDLRVPVDKKYHGIFDVTTNFGTSEHVVSNQLQVFKTIHDLTRVGGMIAHAVPGVGCNRHGVWLYDVDWARQLAKSQNYDPLIVEFRPVSHNRGQGPHLYLVALFIKRTGEQFNEELWNDPSRGNS